MTIWNLYRDDSNPHGNPDHENNAAIQFHKSLWELHRKAGGSENNFDVVERVFNEFSNHACGLHLGQQKINSSQFWEMFRYLVPTSAISKRRLRDLKAVILAHHPVPCEQISFQCIVLFMNRTAPCMSYCIQNTKMKP
jgi:hypothetical protein